MSTVGSNLEINKTHRALPSIRILTLAQWTVKYVISCAGKWPHPKVYAEAYSKIKRSSWIIFECNVLLTRDHISARYGTRVLLPKAEIDSLEGAIEMCREQNATLSTDLNPPLDAGETFWIGLMNRSDGPRIDDGAYSTISRFVCIARWQVRLKLASRSHF